MWVKLLIGRNADAIVDLPFSAAESSIANGTAARATDAEIVAAGLEINPVAEPANVDVLPGGYRAEPTEVGGFDLFDAAGLRINEQPIPNMAALLSTAHEHRHAVVPQIGVGLQVELDDLERLKAEFDSYRLQEENMAFVVYDPAGVAIQGGPFPDRDAAELARRQHHAAALGFADLEEYEVMLGEPRNPIVDGMGGARIEVPSDWRDLHHSTRRALARDIAGKDIESTAEADSVIVDYLATKQS